jgi:hypothetical protein
MMVEQRRDAYDITLVRDEALFACPVIKPALHNQYQFTVGDNSPAPKAALFYLDIIAETNDRLYLEGRRTFFIVNITLVHHNIIIIHCKTEFL